MFTASAAAGTATTCTKITRIVIIKKTPTRNKMLLIISIIQKIITLKLHVLFTVTTRYKSTGEGFT